MLALPLAMMPTGSLRLSPTGTVLRLVASTAAGCERKLENGEVPVAFEVAVANVEAIVAGAPFAASWLTAEVICE